MKLYLNLHNTETLLKLKLLNELSLKPFYNLLKNCFKRIKLSGVYFGQEFCSELIPRSNDIKKTVNFCSKNKLDFVYVTGPTGQKDIWKIKKNLEFLNSTNKKVEVVINEWGILNIINKNFSNLVPVLGRLLVKNRRMAHFDSIPTPCLDSISTPKAKIIKNQKEILNKTNLNIKKYLNFLKKSNINRVGLDLVRTGLDLKHIKKIKIDIYSPDAYITGGRICRLAGIFEPKRSKNITNRHCKRYCIRNELTFTPSFDGRIFYKYNSIFIKNEFITIKNFIINNINFIDRVIITEN